jgi:hypothetical protein
LSTYTIMKHAAWPVEVKPPVARAVTVPMYWPLATSTIRNRLIRMPG